MFREVELLIEKFVNSIKDKRSALNEEACRLRTPKIIDQFDKKNQDAWCLAIMGDSLVKLRLFTEQNFNFIETMGIISVTRYIFEVSIWLKLLDKNPLYGLVYYSQLLETQKRYWQDYEAQIKREIKLLQDFGNDETVLLSNGIKKMILMNDGEKKQQDAKSLGNKIAQDIDNKAARHFSIYTDQAKINGYAYQSHLVEMEELPQIQKAIRELAEEKKEFDITTSKSVLDLIPKKWNWKVMANKVDMENEYNFIYTFSSKLLHATPASITTNHKNLELTEILIFLKFIDTKLMDILDLSRKY